MAAALPLESVPAEAFDGEGMTATTAHVDAEFGAISETVRFHERHDSADSGVQAAAAAAATGSDAHSRFSRAQWARLRDSLWHRRWLRQYFPEEGVLIRERVREGHVEELYLDLIVVASIAALAHDLRHGYDGITSVQDFGLLFSALYSSWRTLTLLWNAYGIKGVRGRASSCLSPRVWPVHSL